MCDKFVAFFKTRQILDEGNHDSDESVKNGHANINVCMSEFDQFSQVTKQEVVFLNLICIVKTLESLRAQLWAHWVLFHTHLPLVTSYVIID